MTHLDTHLSLRFNLALGLIPGLMAILLAFFIPHEQAIYIGTLIGVLASLYVWIRLNKEPKQVLLFSATFMLMLMSLSHSISFCHCPDSYQSLVIEIAVTLPAVLVIFVQKGLRTHRPTNAEKKHRYPPYSLSLFRKDCARIGPPMPKRSIAIALPLRH